MNLEDPELSIRSKFCGVHLNIANRYLVKLSILLHSVHWQFVNPLLHNISVHGIWSECEFQLWRKIKIFCCEVDLTHYRRHLVYHTLLTDSVTHDSDVFASHV